MKFASKGKNESPPCLYVEREKEKERLLRRFSGPRLPYVRGHRGSLKTAVKPILKSLRSLSLAAQIDVRPCFTFNSIGQKTAIRWRDASDAGALCRRSRSLSTGLCFLSISCGPPARCARGKGSLELSARGSADTELSLSITRRRGLAAENERLQPELSLDPLFVLVFRNNSRHLPSESTINPLNVDLLRK